MNCCLCHKDPLAGACNCNCADRKKFADREINQKEIEGKSTKWAVGDMMGCAMVALLLLGFATAVLYVIVPGFLKPDIEVQVIAIQSDEHSKQSLIEIVYVYENESLSDYFAPENVSIAVRKDGKLHTSVVFKWVSRSSYRIKAQSIVILTPDDTDRLRWQNFIDLRQKEKNQKIRDLNSPRRVSPTTP